MKSKLTMMLLCMMMAVTALAQSAISGTVISAQDGEPVIGAAVKVKGETQGVVTNIDGKFTINVEAGKTLVFSYVGMQTKEATAKNGMTVTLAADDKLLDEVVVTALGISREKKSLGYAVQDVKADKLNQNALLTTGTDHLTTNTGELACYHFYFVITLKSISTAIKTNDVLIMRLSRNDERLHLTVGDGQWRILAKGISSTVVVVKA